MDSGSICNARCRYLSTLASINNLIFIINFNSNAQVDGIVKIELDGVEVTEFQLFLIFKLIKATAHPRSERISLIKP